MKKLNTVSNGQIEFAEAVYHDSELSIGQKIKLLETAKPDESAYESCQRFLQLLKDENLLEKIF